MYVLQDGKLALQGYTDGFMSISSDETVIAISKQAGEDEIVQIRSQTVREINPLKDVPQEEQGSLEQIEVNYV